MQTTGRVYGGRSEAERRADRRERLLAAGLNLFGTEGWSGTSIERLCTAAGVATRSFYEEYASREQLLLAVYDEVLAGAAQRVLHAVEAAGADETTRTRAGVEAYVGHLTDDPRRAQVVNREVRAAGGLPEVTAHRNASLHRFSELIALEVRSRRSDQDPDERRVLALALTGAVNEVLSDWVSTPPPRPPTEPIVRELTRLYVAALGTGA
ncbi:MAG: transcriptional regulator [Frankiales bacterium]|nr:transcriptional regulator [Frankiales bacterium]